MMAFGMNGAQPLLATLIANGVGVCFANPGASEMHVVAALDQAAGMRSARALRGRRHRRRDGFARMTGHAGRHALAPGAGLANGLSNLHNAMRAQSPVVNVIGDHATYHRRYDAPLTSDVEGTARPFSHWVRTTPDADAVAADAAAAIAAARTAPGRVASLIRPTRPGRRSPPRPPPSRPPCPLPPSAGETAIHAAVRILRSGETRAFSSGRGRPGRRRWSWPGRSPPSPGLAVLPDAHHPDHPGAGRVPVQRIPYPVGQAVGLLAGLRNLILVGAKPPVAFFAYPGKPSRLAAAGRASTSWPGRTRTSPAR